MELFKFFIKTSFLVLLLDLTQAAIIDRKYPQCGYPSCHPVKDGYINVHLIPHTHDDVGWLKTVDQYYYGSKNTIQNAGVQYILDSVIDELKKNPDRRFIYVETAFFWKWWIHQHDIVKHQVKRLINNGQLEFIGGAWSMNDEATTHYQSIIDQFSWGLRKLNDSFGECGRPKIGWQIDPFGHSRGMASIFSQLGFDGILLGRIDFQDKSQRFKTKTLEMVWQGSPNLGGISNIFTGVMYNTYSPPSGFCWDIMCNDEPLIDDKKSPLYNIDRKINNFFEYVRKMSKVYRTNHLIVTMGGDFNYQNANTWFKNLDKLIYYANLLQNTTKFNLIYSTPSCYIKAIYDEKKQWPLKTDDFFPYASDQHSFWTGYFTSRPTIKRFERIGNNFLQICKQLYAITDLGPEDAVDLNALREAMGVMQHHDAVTGTEKQHVANDYARILQNGLDECGIITNIALNKLISNTTSGKSTENWSSCLLTNISSCPLSETENRFIITVYNPSSRAIWKFVRLPVVKSGYRITNAEGYQFNATLIPLPKAVLNMPGRKSLATFDLVFEAGEIQPLGFKTFYIEKVQDDQVLKPINGYKFSNNKNVSIEIDKHSGLLSTVSMNGKTLNLTQNFYYYNGYVGNNEVPENRSSGAYIFRPNGPPIEISSKVSEIQIYHNDLITEIHQNFNSYISQIIRLYRNMNFVEFDWIVGPIPHNFTNGREIITRFITDLRTDSILYTDSNGRELLKRIRNHRPTWPLNLTEPVSGNYYPITSKIVLVDNSSNVEFAVLTDRSQGGSSLQDGQLEIMIHRNCLHDDAFGVGEALNETAFGQGLVVRGSHYLIFGPFNSNGNDDTTAALERYLAQEKQFSSWTFLSKTNQTFEQYKSDHKLLYLGIKRHLPPNIQILTLEPWKGTSLLLRLEHIFEKYEDPILSQSTSVNLKDLFTNFDIISIKETTLGANQWLSDSQPLRFVNEEHSEFDMPWKQQNQQNNSSKKRATVIDVDDLFVIELQPMQIRTFIIEVVRK